MTTPRFSLAREQVEVIARGYNAAIVTAEQISTDYEPDERGATRNAASTKAAQAIENALIKCGCPSSEVNEWVVTIIQRAHALRRGGT